MKPRTVRTPSSNASHGFRSRHVDPPGALSRPPTMRGATTRPGAVARRLDGASAWRNDNLRAAAMGAARRSLSIRSRIGAERDELPRRV